MQRLRWSITALMFHLALFFNLERLDFGEENIIDIQTFVYVIGIFAATSLVALPTFRRRSLKTLLIGWLIVYFSLRLTIFNVRPLMGGLNLYLTITELVLLGIVIVLAYRVGQDLQDFEQAVINITLPRTNKQVRRIDEAIEDIQTEMLRSRRYQRPLSVTIVRPEPESMAASLQRSIREIQQAMIARYVLNSLMRVIADLMRRTDTVLETTNADEIIIVTPETNGEQVKILVDRVRVAAAQQLGITLACGSAAFPQDALTFEELVRTAERQALIALPPALQGKERIQDGINTEVQ